MVGGPPREALRDRLLPAGRRSENGRLAREFDKMPAISIYCFILPAVPGRLAAVP